MSTYNVTVSLTQSTEFPPLDSEEIAVLWTSIPGGGIGFSADGIAPVGPREFAVTVPVEADTAEEAEEQAPGIVLDAFDADRFPGWQVTRVSAAKPVD